MFPLESRIGHRPGWTWLRMVALLQLCSNFFSRLYVHTSTHLHQTSQHHANDGLHTIIDDQLSCDSLHLSACLGCAGYALFNLFLQVTLPSVS